MKLKTAITALLAASTLISTAAKSFGQAGIATVGLYDAPTNANIVDLNNVAAPLTYPLFTGGLPGGFAANLAGVANFDQPQTAPWPAVGINFADARYGVGMTQNMRLLFSAPATIAGPLGGAVPISGLGVLRAPASAPAAPFTIRLQPMTNNLAIRRVGLTIPQQITRQTIRVNWIQNGGPILTAAVTPAAGAIPTRDICFARQATVVGGIVAVQVSVVNPLTGGAIPFNIEDLAFQQ